MKIITKIFIEDFCLVGRQNLKYLLWGHDLAIYSPCGKNEHNT